MSQSEDEKNFNESDDEAISDIEDLERRRQELLNQLGDQTNEDDDGSYDSDESCDSDSFEDKDIKESDFIEESASSGSRKRLHTGDRLKDEPKEKKRDPDVEIKIEAGSLSDSSDNGEPSDAIPPTPMKCPLNQSQTFSDKLNSSIDHEISDTHEALEIAESEDTSTREKIVPLYRRSDILEVLPVDWVEITHSSGVPVYLHRPTRVCTFSRPYHLGKGSVRNHEIPLIAIPCLHERRMNEVINRKEKEESEALVKSEKGLVPNRVKQACDDLNVQLSPAHMNEYASKLFRMKTIQVRHFRKWKETREHKRALREKMADRIHMHEEFDDDEDEDETGGTKRGIVPSNTAIITAPSIAQSTGKPNLKSVVINPIGKSAVNILHEYAQKMLNGKVEYEYVEVRNVSSPYSCTAKLRITMAQRLSIQMSVREKLAVFRQIQKMQSKTPLDADTQFIGRGEGLSKKLAKMEAAKNALEILTPGLVFNKDGIVYAEDGNGDSRFSDEAITLFDTVPIDAEHVFKLAGNSSLPSPYQLLTESITRNLAYNNAEPKYTTQLIGHKKIQCTMEVADLKVSVERSNKNEGKQYCAQKLLQQMHPELTTYASLLRLYSVEMSRHWDMARQQKEVTSIQNTVADRSNANQAVLAKLCEEMAKTAKAIIVRNGICDSRFPVDATGTEIRKLSDFK